MGLLTLFFVSVFAVFYIGKTMGEKPAFLAAVFEKIEPHMPRLSIWGIFYGAVALILSPMVAGDGFLGGFIRFAANVLVLVTALPYALDFLMSKFQGHLTDNVVDKLRALGGLIVRHEKTVGYIAAAVAVLLFSVLFR